MPYILRYDKVINRELQILIDTGATSCYIKAGIYNNKNELNIFKRVNTINRYTIIKYYHIIHLFGVRQIFYEIDNLESDLLIGYKFLKKINAVINLKNKSLKTNPESEQPAKAYASKYKYELKNRKINKEITLGARTPKAPAEGNTGKINKIKAVGQRSPTTPADDNTGKINKVKTVGQRSPTRPAEGNTGKRNNIKNVGQRSPATPVDEFTDNEIKYLNKITLEEKSFKTPTDVYSGSFIKNNHEPLQEDLSEIRILENEILEKI